MKPEPKFRTLKQLADYINHEHPEFHLTAMTQRPRSKLPQALISTNFPATRCVINSHPKCVTLPSSRRSP